MEDKLPVLVVGGKAGSFLGEYQAGGVIVVLGLGCGARSGRVLLRYGNARRRNVFAL